MGDSMSLPNNAQAWLDQWGMALKRMTCKNCAAEFLLAADQAEPVCPNCFRANLELASEPQLNNAPSVIPAFSTPEQFLPFQVSEAGLQGGWQRFVQGLWFPPQDLKIDNLMKRLQACYLPTWLVDSQVQANWQAEAGFNYQVVSHKDRYDDFRGGWRSQEVTETRQRWEPRLGHLHRSYTNIPAPALEDQPDLAQRLGTYDLNHTLLYQKDVAFKNADRIPWVIRLPDRTPQDSWKDALPGFIQTAGEECRRACGADYIRSFRWAANYTSQNWTLLLLPALFTYYLDDERNLHVLSINGHTGRLFGVRRASMGKARSVALWIALAGALVFIASLVGFAFSVVLPVLSLLAGLGLLLTLILGLCAVIPLLVVWGTNRKPAVYQG